MLEFSSKKFERMSTVLVKNHAAGFEKINKIVISKKFRQSIIELRKKPYNSFGAVGRSMECSDIRIIIIIRGFPTTVMIIPRALYTI